MIQHRILQLLLIICFPLLFFGQETLYESILHDSLNREYLTYIPEIYDGTYSASILFVFHGYGAENDYFMNNKVDFRPISDTAGFILVYPQGTKLNGKTHWRTGIGTWTRESTVDDLGFINALIDTLSSDYNINQSRIYATGHSNGGYFSFELASKLSHRIAAIGSNSGTMTVEMMNPSSNSVYSTAILSINGTADSIVNYNGGTPYYSLSVDNVNNYWANINNTNKIPVVSNICDIDTTDGSRIELYEYYNGDNCISVLHYKKLGGDHGFPGSFGNNMDIDARKIIWNFVSKFDINGLINRYDTYPYPLMLCPIKLEK